jgi:hypothetical protein
MYLIAKKSHNVALGTSILPGPFIAHGYEVEGRGMID